MCLNPFTQFLKLKWAEKSRSGMKTNTCKAHKWVRPNSVSNIFLSNKNKRPNATEMAWTPLVSVRQSNREYVANWRASGPVYYTGLLMLLSWNVGPMGPNIQGSLEVLSLGLRENFWLPSQCLLLYKSNVFPSKTYLNCWFERMIGEKKNTVYFQP